ncbi:MAG TPA: HdeD family acid-resistance protein [Myxococcota bacterium]|nr:HdeD family acid-resistance protein [Myxococcota bacterium]
MTTTTAPATAGLFGELRNKWGWLLAMGIVSIALGTFGLARVAFLTLAGVLFFGWLILISGVLQVVQTFQCRGWRSALWHALVAALHVAAGIVILNNPLLASSVLTLMLAGAILGAGILRIVLAFQHRAHGAWIWALLSGAISVALGVFIAAGWPATSFTVIGLFIAIELIFNGWTMVVLALAARRA